MDPVIKPNAGTAEFETDERCRILENWNEPADRDVSIARATVDPGVTTQWHRLRGTTERYLVVEGSGVVEVGDDSPQRVEIGDVVFIPPMVRQRITNDRDDPLVFHAVCSPAFDSACYQVDE
jgi:mannose-6-phosphate isomerase-like protein (cupin superfamily)